MDFSVEYDKASNVAGGVDRWAAIANGDLSHRSATGHRFGIKLILSEPVRSCRLRQIFAHHWIGDEFRPALDGVR